MQGENLRSKRNSSWSNTLVKTTLICGGCVAIFLPAWIPDRNSAQLSRGTVELLQALLLAAAAAVMLGGSPHAGHNRPVCRVLTLGLLIALVGEIDDFVTEFLKWHFPAAWMVAVLLVIAIVSIVRHRRIMVHFFSTLGNHAGSGLIGSALLILYVFNRVIGSSKFWRATLGDEAFSPEIPRICKSYLELFACYLIFIGALGLSITLARRKDVF